LVPSLFHKVHNTAAVVYNVWTWHVYCVCVWQKTLMTTWKSVFLSDLVIAFLHDAFWWTFI